MTPPEHALCCVYRVEPSNYQLRNNNERAVEGSPSVVCIGRRLREVCERTLSQLTLLASAKCFWQQYEP